MIVDDCHVFFAIRFGIDFWLIWASNSTPFWDPFDFISFCRDRCSKELSDGMFLVCFECRIRLALRLCVGAASFSRPCFLHLFDISFIIVFRSPLLTRWHPWLDFGRCGHCLGSMLVALGIFSDPFWFFVHHHHSFRHPTLESACRQPLDTLVERTLHSKATCRTLPKATYAPKPELYSNLLPHLQLFALHWIQFSLPFVQDNLVSPSVGGR